jgi:sporulation protein YlmC with PRC-barrel domain
MRLELGSPVRCADERFGELADVVIDPAKRPVTHLVVTPRQRYRPARLVPIELVKGEHDAISLRCTLEEADALEPIQSGAYLRWGEAPLDDPDWDVGIETVLAPPYSPYSAYGNPLDVDPHISILYDRIPKGEVEIRRASAVMSAEGERLGHVEGFLVDADDALTHVVLERGHLFGCRDVTIPIDAVARVATDSVTLSLTKDEVALLPAVRVLR